MRPADLLPVALFLCSATGCGRDPVPYYDDASYRRAALLASLFAPGNGYSRLRLAEYASGAGGWDTLSPWNPPVTSVAAGELDQAGGAGVDGPRDRQPAALGWDEAAGQGDQAALRALGEQAFFRYPVQLATEASMALGSRAAASRYGFWVDAERGAGGVVRTALADGGSAFAYSCATCHVAQRGGKLIVGLGNDQLDLGLLAVDAAQGQVPADAPQRSWGPGRLDVSSTTGNEPARIPDLRPVRLLSHLQQDATVVQRDLTSLAIRLETLIITSHRQTLRPPRQVALGLAAYVWSLADALPDPLPAGQEQQAGLAILLSQCAGCHAPPGFTGPPVPLEVVGTDPVLGRSPERGTGTYRVPSLYGAGTRPLLLHDAALPSLSALFDPARLRDDYRGGTRPGPVPGHEFGLDLPAPSRAALVHYLQSL